MAPDLPVAERSLWCVRRDDREATAVVRACSFGRELRLSIDGAVVCRRLLTDSEPDEIVAADLLHMFTKRGWVPVAG